MLRRKWMTMTAGIGFVLGLTAPARALDINGFLRQKGAGDLAFSFTTEGYDRFFRGKTKVFNAGVGEVDTQSLGVWFDYGLTDDLTLIGSLPYVDTEGNGTGGFSESDLQDVTVMGAYRLGSAGSTVRNEFIGALGLRTPSSSYNANAPVSVGDGTTDWLLRFVYQLQKGRFYFSQQVGYDLRGEDAPDGVPLYTEVGYTWGRTTVNAFFSKLMADGGTDIGDSGFTFPSNQEEYERGGAKVYVRINNRVGIAVSAFGTLDGRNTGDSSGVSLGVNFPVGRGTGGAKP